MSTQASSRNEVPVFLSAGGHDIFALFTRPVATDTGLAVILLSGGGWIPTIGRGSMWVRIARRLAGDGVASLRLDYHGVGESTGEVDFFRLDRPFSDEIVAAARWLQEQGRRVALVGACFGARSALAAAQHISHLEGVLLFFPPLVDFDQGGKWAALPVGDYVRQAVSPRILRNLSDPRRRRVYLRLARAKLAAVSRRLIRRGDHGEVSPHFLRPFRALVDRQVPIHLVYGDGDDYYPGFEKARAGLLGKLWERAGERLSLTVYDGTMHGVPSVRAQEQVAEAIQAWAARITGAAGDEGRAA